MFFPIRTLLFFPGGAALFCVLGTEASSLLKSFSVLKNFEFIVFFAVWLLPFDTP